MSSAGGDKKWRVFVSSTSKDLQAERATLEKALNQMCDAEFGGMEYFGSRPDKPKDVCLREVGQCDLYVGIFARRYGYVDPETGLSMTELEYRQALSCNIPCLIYLREENSSPETEWDETSPESIAKLNSLKEAMRLRHVVTTFSNPDQLATKVILDLHNVIKESRLPSETRRLTPSELRIILALHFNKEELKTLCFDLGVDYEDLGGDGKSAKARELVSYMERRQKLEELIAEVRRNRPSIDLN